MLRPLFGVSAILLSLAAGFKAGHYYVTAQWDKARLEQSRSAVAYLERNMERAAAADATRDAALARTQEALRRARNAPQQPIQCPPGGDLRAAVIPGLGQRLRDISGAAEANGAAGVGQLHGPAAGR